MNNNKNLEVVATNKVFDKDFTIYGTVDNPLFLAKDVAEWIDNPNPSQMVKTVDDDEKLIYTIYISGQNRECLFLTENGLYEVLMQSRKPIAKSFKKEVKAILHQIRTKGEDILLRRELRISLTILFTLWSWLTVLLERFLR